MLAAAERQHNLCNLQTAAANLQRSHPTELFSTPAFNNVQQFNLFPNNHQNYLIAAAACHQFAAMLSANQNSAILSVNPNAALLSANQNSAILSANPDAAILSANQNSALPLLPLGHPIYAIEPLQGKALTSPLKHRISDTEYNNSTAIEKKSSINS